MSKRYLALIVFIIMSSLIGWQQYIIFSVQKNNTTLKGFLKNNSELEFKGMALTEDIHHTIKYQGEHIKDSIWLFNEYGDSLLLNQYAKEPMFILCINQNGCDVCIDKCIEMTNKISQNLAPGQTSIIGRFSNPLYFYKYKRINKINLPMFHFKTLGIENENSSTPFGFIIEDGRIHKFFIFHKEFDEINEANAKYIINHLK